MLGLEGFIGLHRTVQLQLLQHYWLGHRLDYCDIEWFALETNRDHSVVFEIASKYCISDSFVDHDGYSISSKGFLPTIIDIMFIWIKFIAIIKKSTNNKCWRGCGEKRTFLHCWWERKLIQTLWRMVWRFLKNLGIKKKTYDWAISLLCNYPEKTIIKKTHVPQCLLQCYLQ